MAVQIYPSERNFIIPFDTHPKNSLSLLKRTYINGQIV